MIVKSPDGSRSWTYSAEVNDRKDGLWSIPIYGNTAIVEIQSYGSGVGYGYVIDKIARGFTAEELAAKTDAPSICGEDNTEPAKCYEISEPEVYEASRAVARLWRNGIQVNMLLHLVIPPS